MMSMSEYQSLVHLLRVSSITTYDSLPLINPSATIITDRLSLRATTAHYTAHISNLHHHEYAYNLHTSNGIQEVLES